MHIAVTGAHGFIGKNLCQFLQKCGHSVSPITRKDWALETAPDALSSILEKCDVVIHLAAYVHKTYDDRTLVFQHNVEATQALFNLAESYGVKHFIFASSIGVHGRNTHGRAAVSETTPTKPYNLYTESKLAAETWLLQNASSTAVTALRIPQVYAQNSSCFGLISKLAHKGVPLPFAFLKTEADYISIENLCAAIGQCLNNTNTYNNVFCLKDGGKTYIKDLIARQQPTPRLFPCPVWLLKLVVHLLNKPAVYNVLFCDYRIDNSKWRKATQKHDTAD